MDKKALYILLAGIIVSAGLFFVSNNASAATYTWDGGGVNANWDTPENWSTNVVPTLTDVANFTGPGCSSNCSPTINVSINIQGITTASTYAGTITQATGVTVTITGGSTGINIAGGTFVGSDGLILVASGSGDFIQSGGVFTNSSGGLTVYRNLTLSGGTFNNSYNITLGDNGTAIDTTLTCTGTLPGTLYISKTDVSGTSSDVVISSGCIVNLSAGPTTTLANLTNGGTINVPSGTWTYNSGDTFTLTNNGTINHSGSGWIFYSSGLNNAGTINYSGTTITIDGNFTQSGTFDLTGKTVTFTNNTIDNTTISCTGSLGGKVVFNKVAGSGSTTATVGSGCIINLGDSPTSVLENNLTNNGTIVVDSGTWSYTNGEGQAIINNGTITHNGSGWAMDNTSLTNSGGTINYAGASLSIDLSFTQLGTFDLTGKTVTFTNGASGGKSSTVTCTGSLGGTVVITKSGSTGSGTFTVALGCSINLGTNPTTIFQTDMVNSGTIVINSGTWTMTSVDGNTFTNSGTITHSGSGWDFNGTVHFTNTGTVTYAGSTVNMENNFTQNGTFDLTGKTLTFDGSLNAADSVLTCGSDIQGNVVVNKTDAGGTLTLGSNCVILGNFTKTDGVIGNPGAAYTLEVRGNFTSSTSDSFGGANMTLKFGGTSAQNYTQTAGTISSPVTIDKASGTVTLTSNMTLGNAVALNIVSGIFDQGALYRITVGPITVGMSGTWTNSGIGDVTISGDVTNSGVITINTSGYGQCTDAVDDISITSSILDVTRTWSGSGTFNIFNVIVYDQIGTITAYNSTFSNSTWTNGTCGTTLGGTIYSDEGSTILNTNPVVRAKINGAGSYSGTANSSGVYIILNTTIAANDVITIYLDGATEKAVLITKANGTGSISGLDLYQNRVIVRNEGASPITNTDLDQYDSGNDADIQFTVTAGALTVAASNSLLVPSGATYTPGGSVTPRKLKVAGTLNAGSNTITLSDSGTGSSMPFIVTGTFVAGTGTVKFTGSSNTDVETNLTYNILDITPASGNQTYTATGALNATTFNMSCESFFATTTFKLGGTTIVSGAMSAYGEAGNCILDTTTSNHSLTATSIISNSITANGSTITVTGSSNPLMLDTLNSGTSTIVYTGTSATTIGWSPYSLQSYHNLSLLPASGSPTYTLATGAAHTMNITGNMLIGNGSAAVSVNAATYDPIMNIDGNFTVSASATYTATNSTPAFYLGGDFTNAGTYTHNNSTITFDATDAGNTIALGSSSLYNVVFNGSGGAWSFTAASNTIAGDLTMTAGTLSGTTNITVNGGDLTGNGTINLTGGTFTLSNAQSTNMGGNTNWVFYDFVIGSGSHTATGSGSITANTITATGSLSSGSKTYILTGSGTPLSGSFSASTTSTVRFTGTSATTIPALVTYGTLELKPTSGSPVYTLGTVGDFTFDSVEHLVFGDGVNAVTVDASTRNAILQVNVSITLNSGATYTKGSGTLYIQKPGVTIADNNSTKQDLGVIYLLDEDTEYGVPAGSLTLQTSVKITSVTIGGSANVSLGSYTLTLTGSGSPIASAGSVTVGTGTIEYIGSSATSIYPLTYYNLSVGTTADSNAGVTYTQGSHTTVSNVLTIGNASSTNTDTYVLDTGRSLYLNGSGTPLVITSKGAFTANANSEVSYDGTSATYITGATYNTLNMGTSMDTNSGVTYTLAGNITTGAINVGNLGSTNSDTFSQGVYNITTSGTFGISSKGVWSNLSTGDITLGAGVYNTGVVTLNSNNGSQCINSANDIVITSTSAGVQRTWSGGGTFNLYNLTVTDQAGSVTAYNSTYSNTTWSVGACTISVTGTIYSDEAQTTPLTNGPTVRVKVDGAGSYSAAANGSGVYTVNGVTVAEGSIVTVFLDGATEKAVLVTRAADNYSTITANLVQNRVILRSDDGNPITNTNLDTYDSTNDVDVRFTVAAGELTVTAGSTLLINTATVFTPGGAVTVPAYKQTAGTFNGGSYAFTSSGNVTVTGGVFSATSGTLTMSGGSLDVSGSTFTHNSGSITFTDNNQSINVGSNILYNLTVDNSNSLSAFTVTGDVVVNNLLTLSSGVLAGAGTIQAKKDVVTTSTSGHTGNAIVFNGTGAQSLNASGSSGSLPGIVVDKSSGTLTISDTISLITNSIAAFDHVQGTVDTGTSTIVFKGNNIDIDAAAVDFNNVSIQTANTLAGVTIIGGLDVNGNLNIIDSGVLVGAINLAGNLISTDSDMSGSTATITLDGTDTQTINSGTSYLPTGTFTVNKASGTAQLAAHLNLATTQALIISSGIFDQGASYNLTVGPVTVAETAEWSNTGTGDVVLGGNVSNAGLITFNTSGGSQCVDIANDIVITSSSNGVQRTWSGAGTFVMYNVSATDQLGSVTAYSSTLSNSNWSEGACAGTLSQAAYRWYENVNAGNVSTALGGENSSVTISNQSANLRLRMSIGASGGSIGANTKAFKLQWSPSTISGWRDVVTSSGLIWRFADNAGVEDGATTTGLVLSASNVAGLYREANTTTTNPLQVNSGQYVEYDFALDPVGVTSGSDYYFRLVEVGNVTLNTYANYAKITIGIKNFAGGVGPTGGGSGGGDSQVGGGQSGLPDSSAWWNASWSNRKKITLNNAASSSNLVNFPILVTLSGSNIDYSKTQNSGQDIRFVDADNVTLLSHQIETWNESGNSIVWVKVPQIDASSTTDHIWVYYNNSGASDGQAASSVWNANYKGVWHMNNVSTSVTDSTTTGSTGTPDGPNATYNISGAVGSAVSTDGSGYKIVFSNASQYYPDSAKTYCFWMKTGPGGSGGLRFAGSNSSVGIASDLAITHLGSSNYRYFSTGSTIVDNTWHYLCYRVTGGAQSDIIDSKMWVDGVEQTAGSTVSNGALTPTDTLNLGHWFSAAFDELRISNTARSGDWISAEYRSMANTMNTYASEESRESGSGGGTPQTGGGSGGGISGSP